MSHDTNTRGGADKLIYMANQIATFFESQPKKDAVEGVSKHINDFWEPRMRRQFFEIVDSGGEGLKPLVKEAAKTIRRPAPASSPASET